MLLPVAIPLHSACPDA